MKGMGQAGLFDVRFYCNYEVLLQFMLCASVLGSVLDDISGTRVQTPHTVSLYKVVRCRAYMEHVHEIRLSPHGCGATSGLSQLSIGY